MKFSLSAKIYSVVGLLSLALVATSSIAITTLATYERKVDAVQAAAKRVEIGKEINGLINAVVMESRGIYMSKEKAEAEKFAKPLLASLGVMDRRLTEWQNLLPEHRKGELAAGVESAREFIRFRTELVRLGREVSPAEARVFGDNETNRSNRKRLGERIDALAEQNNVEIAALTQELDAFSRQAFWSVLLIAGLSVLITGVFAGLMVSRGVTGPLRSIIRAMKTLAGGDTAAEIRFTSKSDEIGEMARAVEVFRLDAIERKRLEAEAQAHEARAEAERSQAMAAVAQAFERKVGGLVQTLVAASAQLELTASTMSSAADQTNQQVRVVSRSADDTTANVQAVAAATEELSASAAEVGSQVTETARRTTQAVDSVRRTNATVKALSDGAERIGTVVALINDIAARTNLLALNATIEAARAGEAGRGFAVVATEVKELANQTIKATEEIRAQINQLQLATGEAVTAIQAIGLTIEEVNGIATAIAAAAEEQQAATSEIARSVSQAAQGTGEVRQSVEQVNEAAVSTGAAASQVLASARDIVRCSSDLDSEVHSFLAEMRAA